MYELTMCRKASLFKISVNLCTRIIPGNILINLKGNNILAMSGIEVNVFSKITAPILSLFLDLKGENLSWVDGHYNCTTIFLIYI